MKKTETNLTPLIEINIEAKILLARGKKVILETTKNGQPHSVPMTENVHNILKTMYNGQGK